MNKTCFIVLLLICQRSYAQDIPVSTQQQLELSTQQNSDVAPEDDRYLQDLQYFTKHPVNLNTAEATTIGKLNIFSALQIENIIQYRKSFGAFTDIYELQAVPSLDIPTIEKAKPYITVKDEDPLNIKIRKRFAGGEHAVLLRAGQTLERSKGYLLNAGDSVNYYHGSPQQVFVRYKYQYKQLLQYGFSAEKDAGEQFFRGAQKQGFEF